MSRILEKNQHVKKVRRGGEEEEEEEEEGREKGKENKGKGVKQMILRECEERMEDSEKGEEREEGDMQKEGKDMIERELERRRKEERGWKEMTVNFTIPAHATILLVKCNNMSTGLSMTCFYTHTLPLLSLPVH